MTTAWALGIMYSPPYISDCKACFTSCQGALCRLLLEGHDAVLEQAQRREPAQQARGPEHALRAGKVARLAEHGEQQRIGRQRVPRDVAVERHPQPGGGR